jgi:hypothetical protein
MLASSWFGTAVELILQVIALVLITGIVALFAFVLLLLIMQAINKFMRQALEAARETAKEQRGTGVPALFTLIGAASAPLAGLFVSPAIGAFLAVAIAAVTFISATLAESGKSRAARWIGIVGCILPFLVFTLAALATDNFSGLPIEEKVLVVGALALGWVGVLSALVALRERGQPQPA